MNNCVVCLTSGIVTLAIHGNRLCQAHFDAALAAIVAEDRRGKTDAAPAKLLARRSARVAAKLEAERQSDPSVVSGGCGRSARGYER